MTHIQDVSEIDEVSGTITIPSGETAGEQELGCNMVIDRILVDASAGLGDTFRVRVYEADAVPGIDTPKAEYRADLADGTDHVVPMDYPHCVESDKIVVVVATAVAADKDVPWKVWGS